MYHFALFFSAGETLNIKDAYSHPLFYKRMDEKTGFRTKYVDLLFIFSTFLFFVTRFLKEHILNCIFLLFRHILCFPIRSVSGKRFKSCQNEQLMD